MKAVLQWVLKTMMKDQTGIVRTMPKKDIVDFNVAMTAERLMRNGVDPNSLKNANQVENALDMIDNRPKVQEGIKSTKSAKVFDLKGKEIDPKKGIMGGKQIPDDDLPPPGSRGGPDDISAPIQSEDEILEKLNRENKEATRNLQIKLSKDKEYQKFRGETEEEIRKRFGLDDPEDMATGGRAGFVVGGITGVTDLAMRLARGFMKVTGRKPNDKEIMKIIREAAERDFAKVSDDVALKGVSETRATARRMDSIDKNKLKKEIDEYNIPVRTQEQFDFAQGGRAGFKLGSIDKARRAFLKTMGAAGAGITALKTGILGLGKEAAPAVEAVKETVTQAPSYFFDLVAKIKLLGEPRRTPSYKERVNEYQYTGKNGIEYELIEDLDTGEITIQKDKIGGRSFEEGSYEVIEDRTEMRYRKPKPDEGDPNPAEEYEEYKVEFDQEGTAADASEIDEISKKEIIREVTEDAPSIKKAGGGIARMLGE